MSTPILTVIGRLTRDPELRTTQSGRTVVNLTIAASDRRLDRNTNQWEDGDKVFLNASAWDNQRSQMASNIARSLSKGMLVIAEGRLSQRTYQANDGTQRVSYDFKLNEIGPALSHASAQVQRQQAANSTQDGQPQYGGGYQGGAGWGTGQTQPGPTDPFSQPADDDPWATPASPTPTDQEPEF